jgi:hypothetical protein
MSEWRNAWRLRMRQPGFQSKAQEGAGTDEGDAQRGVKVAAPPATPRHTMFPPWLLPSGPDQVNG